jgi:hypothetical protein
MNTKRTCKECGKKLPSRNGNRKSFTNLCQHCFTHPPDEHRCHAITSKGTRCAFRITGESRKLCKIHSRRQKR